MHILLILNLDHDLWLEYIDGEYYDCISKQYSRK